jgi:hypothetical protein
MRCKDEFRMIIKTEISMRGEGVGNHRWGCPCCVPYRLVGCRNNRKLARRHARRKLKTMDRNMEE